MPRFCDIVMKGGITSGIVYPAAVFEIAKDFVFKNVGGTSAGAIAAAVTAAAERRRARDGSMEGFKRVAAIPDYLSTDSRLYRLFTPNASTRSLFHTVVGIFGRTPFKALWRAWLLKWWRLVQAYRKASVIGGLVGALSLVSVLSGHRGGAWLVAGLAWAFVTILAGVTFAVAVALVHDLMTQLPKNQYGMVTGVDDADRSSLAALCTWLTRELELTAGLQPGIVPLTFGMLWDAQRDVDLPALDEKPKGAKQPDVNLEMITTNVTWGRPFAFPTDKLFYYDPEQLRRYFPDHVIEWMKKRPRKAENAKEQARFDAYAPEKLPLPLPADLPVIVATRMSLAFPVLLSAVPLYAADFSMPMPEDGIPKLEPVWFSDGGISSNFPITMFDSPLPRWPTFAINLEPFHPAHPRQDDESMNVYMPPDNRSGWLPTFNRFDKLRGFFTAIADAMQNWNDNTQSRLPGYRDRIVTVFLDADEGGLNLDMPQPILERLRNRGTAAGALIAERFREPSQLPPGDGAMDWENHRWLRFRSTMGALRSYLPEFAEAFRAPQALDKPYEDLILATDGTPAHHYEIKAGERANVDTLAKHLADLGDEIFGEKTLEDDLPHPPPQLVLRGSLET